MFEQRLINTTETKPQSIVGDIITLEASMMRFFYSYELDFSDPADPTFFDCIENKFRSSQECNILDPDLWLPIIVNNYAYNYCTPDLEVASIISLPAVEEMKERVAAGCAMLGTSMPDDVLICGALCAAPDIDELLSNVHGYEETLSSEAPLDMSLAAKCLANLANTAVASVRLLVDDDLFRFASIYQQRGFITWSDLCLAASVIQQEPRLAKLGPMIKRNIPVSYHWSSSRILETLEAKIYCHLDDVDNDVDDCPVIKAQVADILKWFETLDHDRLSGHLESDPSIVILLQNIVAFWSAKDDLQDLPTEITTTLLTHLYAYEEVSRRFSCDPKTFFMKGYSDESAERHFDAIDFYLKAIDFMSDHDPFRSFASKARGNTSDLGFIPAASLWFRDILDGREKYYRGEKVRISLDDDPYANFPIPNDEIANELIGLYDGRRAFDKINDVLKDHSGEDVSIFFSSFTPLDRAPLATIFAVLKNRDKPATFLTGFNLKDGELLPERASQILMETLASEYEPKSVN